MAAGGTQGEKGVHIQIGDTWTQEIFIFISVIKLIRPKLGRGISFVT